MRRSTQRIQDDSQCTILACSDNVKQAVIAAGNSERGYQNELLKVLDS